MSSEPNDILTIIRKQQYVTLYNFLGIMEYMESKEFFEPLRSIADTEKDVDDLQQDLQELAKVRRMIIDTFTHEEKVFSKPVSLFTNKRVYQIANSLNIDPKEILLLKKSLTDVNNLARQGKYF